MKTLILLTTLFLIGCGADPDDFKAKESDGCRSDDKDCLAAKISTDTDTDTEANDSTVSVSVNTQVTVNGDVNSTSGSTEAALNCQAGKLCRGMTKEEVIEILGEPKSIKDVYSGIVRWDYSDPDNGSLVCTSDWFCDVTFDKHGKLLCYAEGPA